MQYENSLLWGEILFGRFCCDNFISFEISWYLESNIAKRAKLVNLCSPEEPAPRLAGFEFEAPAERDCLGSLRAPIAIMVL